MTDAARPVGEIISVFVKTTISPIASFSVRHEGKHSLSFTQRLFERNASELHFRALRFLVRRPRRLRETMGSGNENEC